MSTLWRFFCYAGFSLYKCLIDLALLPSTLSEGSYYGSLELRMVMNKPTWSLMNLLLTDVFSSGRRFTSDKPYLSFCCCLTFTWFGSILIYRSSIPGESVQLLYLLLLLFSSLLPSLPRLALYCYAEPPKTLKPRQVSNEGVTTLVAQTPCFPATLLYAEELAVVLTVEHPKLSTKALSMFIFVNLIPNSLENNLRLCSCCYCKSIAPFVESFTASQFCCCPLNKFINAPELGIGPLPPIELCGLC